MTGPPSPPDLLRHAAFVRAVARAALRGDDLVDDVVQETWVAALEGGAARATRLRPWLGGVARRQAANLLRRRIATRERERRVARPESQASTTADGADVADRAEMGRALVGAVLGLEEPYRTAVLLRYYDDLPPREIAKRTGVPVETARTHVKRGLQRLRRLLDEDARRHGRSAPVLLLPLLDGGRRSLGSVLPLVGGLLAVKKLLLALGVLLGVVLGAYAVRHHSLPGSAPTGTPPVDVAAAPAPPRLEGTADGDAASTTATAAADAPSREHVAAETTSFRGVVVDPEGNPIPGVTVEIDRYPAMHFSQHGGADVVDPDDVAPVTSDDDGRFRLEVPGSAGFVQARTRAEDWVAAAPFGLGLSSQNEDPDRDGARLPARGHPPRRGDGRAESRAPRSGASSA